MNKRLKKLIEQKHKLVDEANELCLKAEKEERALTTEEAEAVEEKLEEIKEIAESIKVETELHDLELEDGEKKAADPDNEEEREADEEKKDKEKEEIESRAFAEYIRSDRTSYHEKRADVNMTKGNNGAVIPKTIADRILETVKDISPILSLATTYNIGGKLSFPVYDETNGKIQCAYKEEFTELESSTGEFTEIELAGFLAGALTKVSRSLINNSSFDITSYVITKLAEAIAEFLETELLLGNNSKMIGVATSKNVVTTAAAAAITADELIDLQAKVKKRFRSNGVFIMNPITLTQIRKLKNANGEYILNPDYRTGFGDLLLGCRVEESDAMPVMEAGKIAVAFGDYSGLTVKFAEQLEIQVLREKYATQHAIGVVGWIEADSKITEPQKIAILKMKA